jgi:inositol transport system substrate-binding protein
MPERDMWLAHLEQAVEDRAAELGVDLTVFDAERDITQQMSHVQTFAAQGFDAIIIGILEQPFTETLVNYAGDIPVIFVNREPDNAFLSPGSGVGYVGSDENTSGAFQADYLAAHFAGRTDPIDYVLFMGILGHPATAARSQSFRDGMEAEGFTLNNVFEQTANFDRAEAMDLMQQFIGTGVNFDAVVANNDEMALGAFEALRAAGMTDIPVVGIDAGPPAIASIQAGEMSASVFQNPVGQGAGAMDKAVAAARGESFPPITWVPFELVTPENAGEYWN